MIARDKRVARINTILKREAAQWQVPVIELIKAQTDDPFKVLVATVMSARTKDSTTAVAATKLFEIADTPAKLASLTLSEIEKLIFPVGFYKTKAKHLKELAKRLIDEFDAVVPDSLESLTTLHGVGRKTANIVLVNAFAIPAIGVDVHVHRISNRLGLIRTSKPFETEQRLMRLLPKKWWSTWNRNLVALGQGICTPTSPKCSVCPLHDECRRVGVTRSR